MIQEDIGKATNESIVKRALESGRLLAVVWLLVVGLWSGPSFGATLVYPNALLEIELTLVAILLILARYGRIRPLRKYPFFWPSLGVIALCGLAALARIFALGTAVTDEVFRLWKNAEPMARGLLLYLAIAGERKLIMPTWFALLGGLLLPAGAAVFQHVTHVSRWYADLDSGWAAGWQPVGEIAGSFHHPGRAPRVQGLTSYINLTAAMLAASVPFFAVPVGLRVPEGGWRRIGLFCGGILTAAALLYTGSRGPLLALFSVALLLCWHAMRAWRISSFLALGAFTLAMWLESKRIALVAFLAAIGLAFVMKRRHLQYLLPVIIGLGFAGALQGLDAYVLHYQLSWRVSEESLSRDGRTLLYTDALRAIGQSPWWGIGDANVAQRVTSLPRYTLQHLPATQQNYHNQLLHWAAAEGVPVAIAFTFLVCWAVWWCWRMGRRSRDPFAHALGWATAAGLLAFLLSNLVDAHFWRIEGAGFFWSLLAVAVAVGKTMQDPDCPE